MRQLHSARIAGLGPLASLPWAHRPLTAHLAAGLGSMRAPQAWHGARVRTFLVWVLWSCCDSPRDTGRAMVYLQYEAGAQKDAMHI